ncbi:MAG: SCO family protein [Deltaproteobacteria bacterium]|nr:SCO family protein [Deltaproteobacteria bacterium]
MSTTVSPAAAGERWVWAALALLLVVIAVAAAVSWSRRVPAPDVLGAVPDFALTERSGQPLTRATLDGQPWVADFIFTRCTGMCPALSTRMAELRRRAREAGAEVRFVSFSVDPTYDTPERLSAYAQRFGAGDDWFFVTGARDALYQLIGSGFRLSVAERAPEAVASEGGELITHSDRFVLVDGAGRIRGYYHGGDADLFPALLRDLGALQAEAGR